MKYPLLSIYTLVVVFLPHLSPAGEPIQFERDIRPILSDNCFHCHGPDEAERQAGLRLDTREGAFALLDGKPVILSGKPEESLLIHRVLSDDPNKQMPPPEAKKKFGAAERDLLHRWITEGAPWSEHWAFVPPERPTPPTSGEGWARNPIDHFIAAGWESRGLAGNDGASRETLIRRLSLDLTGLPPTPDEIDAFLTDSADNAYERLVDRLLNSPHYGERMAWPWLDAARYADTNGYQGDRERTMYPWRDWVVKAFNENMPFDEFTTLQLAGDLLPDPTRDQVLATAFNRNHMINGEGGRIAEENRVEYIFDQLETVGTVWMGLTFNCARCHDHKYDPLLKADYYALFDYFNQTEVTGAGGDPRTPPNIPIHTKQTEARMAALMAEITAHEETMAARQTTLAPGQNTWEKEALAKVWENEKRWSVLEVTKATATHQALEVLDDGALLATGELPENEEYHLEAKTNLSLVRALRLEALRYVEKKDGRLLPAKTGNFVLTDLRVSLRYADGTESPLPFARASATYEQGNFAITAVYDDDPESGWAIYEGVPIDRDQEAVLHFEEPVVMTANDTLIITLKHDSKHKQHILRHFRLSVTEEANPPLAPAHHDIAPILRTPPEHRPDEDAARLVAAFHDADPEFRDARRARQKARDTLQDIDNKAIRVMVMADQPERRTTTMFRVGLYNQPEGAVTAATPAFLFSPPPKEDPANRLDLARWLLDPRHPLTARVTVNRLWADLFGTGLVKTTENFGVQGELPSHPELLDWLAVEFVESGWDVKALLRLMVTSATYRQSPVTTTEKTAIDPTNRYLARGPRFRMPSWMIRDQALAAGGLLVNKLGGPPVKPYQPAGLWAEFSFGKLNYAPDAGEALYRRSLYTYWRRIVAPPMFFDASSRQTCSVKATRTNTPLHALATLNDPTYVEAARTLAGQLLTTADVSDRDRINQAFRVCLARSAQAEELDLLEKSLERMRQEFRDDPEGAVAYLAVGASTPLPGLDTADYAAYASLCLSILNTDEALTKE